jgi:hypothetical protein
VPERAKAAPSRRASATSGEPATDGRSRCLWFNAPTNDQDRRPELTRERVVAEALTVIAPTDRRSEDDRPLPLSDHV